MMKNRSTSLVLLFILTILFPAITFCREDQPSSSTFVINNVTIVNVEKGTLEKNRSVTVSGTTLRKISSRLTDRASGGVRIVDGTGLYLMPSLFDAHIHYFDQAEFGPMMIA